jgi:hypothetical protein
MSLSVEITTSLRINGENKSGSAAVVAGKVDQWDLSGADKVPASSTDLEVAAVIDVSQLKFVYIKSDVAVKLETNSSSAPDNTINLEAGVPVTWVKPAAGSIPACPFSVDVTKFFFTESNGVDAAVEIIVGVDPTV